MQLSMQLEPLAIAQQHLFAHLNDLGAALPQDFDINLAG